MTYNVHNHAKETGFKGRIINVSTGALYDPTQPLPLEEKSRTASNSPYAVGKLSAEAVALYFRGRGIDTVTARPFNHIGPGQGRGFLLPDLYAQLHEAESGDTIRVGNLDTRRDYTDVRDIARAYSDLVEAEKLNYSLYNVCSDKSISGFQILDIIRKVAGLEDINALVDPSKLRPNEIMDIRGDYSRLYNDTGWTPSVSLEETIADFVARAK
jgi:GDP-4-dehydro-6-deoxy-D-mannose reductase